MIKLLKIVIVFVCLLSTKHLAAQKLIHKLFSFNNDSVYYSTLSDMLTLKVYTQHHLAPFSIANDSLSTMLNYDIIQRRSLGIGFSYKWIGLSGSYGFPILNQNSLDSQKNWFWNFQSQFHFRKLILSVYANSFEGYYLENAVPAIQYWDSSEVYYRPDINVSTYGVNFIYINNPKRYSNKATFDQTEWQKKTAGTLVLGGNIFQYSISSDSSLIPQNALPSIYFNGADVDYFKQRSYGMGAGYALNLVLKKHLFFNMMILAGINVSQIEVSPAQWQQERKWEIGPMANVAIGLGYNSKKFYWGMTSSIYALNADSDFSNSSISFQTGTVKFIIAYRFKTKKDYLSPIVNRIFKLK